MRQIAKTNYEILSTSVWLKTGIQKSTRIEWRLFCKTGNKFNKNPREKILVGPKAKQYVQEETLAYL